MTMAASTSFIDIQSHPTVVILEDDYDTIMPIMLEIIGRKLGWEIEFVKSGDEAAKKKSQFYILDIKLGEGERQQEGITTAEIIKELNESVFVSLFSGIPNLESLRRQARRIGVDYIEEKSNLKVNVCNIAIEMLFYREKLLLECLKEYSEFGDTETTEIIIELLEKVKDQTQVIYTLEKSYYNDSIAHSAMDELSSLEKVYSDDENIQVYEKKYKADKKWFKKYEGRYVAFVNGQWLGEDFVADSKDKLFELLHKSDDYKDQGLFYTCVKNDDILEDDIESIPRLSSAVQMRMWKFR